MERLEVEVNWELRSNYIPTELEPRGGTNTVGSIHH